MVKRSSPFWRSFRVTVVGVSFLAPASAFAATQPGGRSFSTSSSSHPTKTALKMNVNANKLQKEIADYNSCTAATVALSNAHVVENDQNMLLRLTRTVEDIDNDKKRNYEYIFPISKNGNDSKTAFSQFPPTEVSPNIQGQIPSPSGRLMAVIRADDVKEENTPAKQVLEVWESDIEDGLPSSLVHRIALPSDLHGKVIVDPVTFGRPSWSPDEKVLVYVAERKKPETTSFFDPKAVRDKDYKKIPGGQHTLGVGKSEHWGEVLFSQEPLFDLYLVHVETGRVAKVANVPGTSTGETTSIGSYTLGTPVFSPDGKSVVYTAWDAGGGIDMPKRLGLIYCIQRASKLHASSITKLLDYIAQPQEYPSNVEKPPKEAEDYVCLTKNLRLARSPRFNDAGVSTLVFLASEKGFDTHFGHLELRAMEWKDGVPGEEKVVVKQHWNIRDASCDYSEGIVEGIPFPGLAIVGQLPERCFVSPDTMVACTVWGSSFQLVRINMDGQVRLVKAGVENDDSWSKGLITQEFLCTTPSGGIILKQTSPNNPGAIVYVTPEELMKENIVEDGVKAAPISKPSPISSSTCSLVPRNAESLGGSSYQVLTLERPSEDGNKWNAPIQCILMLPNQREGAPKPPLICLPHGGPHSVSSADYLATNAFLCGNSGYALLYVNYRGSIGFGQDAVEDLPSRIGDLDVKDVIHAVKHCADSGLVDPDRLGICGGSHGGFLTGHCIGQYPDLFKCACLRNPVTNIASMFTATDIPDWCLVSSCGIGQYDWTTFTAPTEEQLTKMYKKSPVAHSRNVKAPTLIALGTKDLRVPPSQGIEYYHILRSLGVETKLLLYDDSDHAIAGVHSKADHWLNIKRWFDEHLL